MTDKDKVFHILLAEDNPMDILVMKEALKHWQKQYQLHIAENGNDAMDFLLKKGHFIGAEKPDLTILDLNLPKRNGIEILSQIRTNPDISDITVVVITTAATTFEFQ
jgi:CheY-like chemotaxis protein